jgi:E-phenylitaconyl-CoA hydratase
MTEPTSVAPILVAHEDGVRTIQFNRPHRLNALNPDAMVLLNEELRLFRDDEGSHVCVITGSGDKAFCTGADLRDTMPPSSSFAQGIFSPAANSVANGNYIQALDISYIAVNKPIIAAVNGYAMGGGCELALSCDICIASSNAVFALPEVRVGSIPAVGGIQQLIRSIGKSAAMSMILTGRHVGADEALRLGLISEVVPPEQLMSRANELAREIAANAPLAVRAALMLANEGRDLPLSSALLLERLTWGTLRDTEDRIEGRRAFAEKRKPMFKGA